MYIDIANMTLEEVARVTTMLSSARVEAYLSKVGKSAYLYTVPREEGKRHINEPILAEI